MRRSHRSLAYTFILGIHLLLVACSSGGGGGGGGGSVADTDGDGLSDQDEVSVYRTSPTLADTDGAGYSDSKEVGDLGFDPVNNNYRFNPLIADTPRLSISVTSEPDIDIDYTETTGAQVTKGTTHTDSTSSTLTTELVTSNGVKIEDTHDAGAEVSLEDGKPTPKVSYSFKSVATRENTAKWSQTKVDEHRQIHTEAVEYANSHSIATSGGSLSYTIQVKNEGHIAFTLTNLSLTALAGQPTDPGLFEPVANLEIDTRFASYPSTTIGPGTSTGNLLFSKADLDTPTVLDLLRDSSGLVTEVATFDVLDENGVSFVQRETDIAARTAMVIIEYAPGLSRAPESYAVATNADPANQGITARQALTDILRVPYETTSGHLTAVRGVATAASPESRWLVLTVTGDDVNRVAHTYDGGTPYDFDTLPLKAGDVLHLVHVADTDGEGLADRQELLYYTDPTKVDTDGDGLTDREETQGVSITVNGSPVTVHSNPTRADDDGDGLTDPQELGSTTPTSPSDADTDRDRLGDADDPYPVDTDVIDIADVTATPTTSGIPNVSLTWFWPADDNQVVVGMLWLYYLDPGDGSAIPEPTVTPTAGQLYQPGQKVGDWTVLTYLPSPHAPNLDAYGHVPPAAAVGTYKYVSFVEVDLDQNAVGDRYLRSTDSPLVPWAVSTDTFEVQITGLDLAYCLDYATPEDFICEPYWTFKLNGTKFPTGNLAKPDAAAIILPGRVRTFAPSNPFQIVRPRTNGSCVTVQGDIADSDDRSSSTAGDEHGLFTSKPVCYNNGWVGLKADPTTPYFVRVTLTGGKIGWLRGASRTFYDVYYTVRLCPAAGCTP